MMYHDDLSITLSRSAIMTAPLREKFATQVEASLLAEIRELARSEGRQIQALIDEALADLVEKRRSAKPRPHVMALYQASHARYEELYKNLAK
jgi:hypothetical protein